MRVVGAAWSRCHRLLGTEIGNGVKGQAALLDLARPGAAQLFAEGLHVVPHLDGTVAIGSTSERYFKSPDQTDGQLDDLIAKAKRLFPELRDAPVIERWAGVRPRAFTRAPMLGQASGSFRLVYRQWRV